MEFLDQFRDPKKLASIIILLVLVVAVPLGLKLIREQQICKSRAGAEPIVIKETADVFQRNGQWVAKKDAKISLELTSPLGPAGSPPPSDAPSPTPNRRRSEEKIYNINVLVIKYFPLTDDGQKIDISVTGDIGGSYQGIRQHAITVTNNLTAVLEKATKYLGYKNPAAPSSLLYNIIDNKEYTQAVPIKPRSDSPRYPDYNAIMTSHNICDYVDNKGVREVWLWAYQGPNQSDGQPYLGILESKMSGPYGDISNSYRYNDMPVCKFTYRVYTFNYGRGTSEAFESWGHQIESEMKAVDETLFRDKFQGPYHPQKENLNGRCGSVHNPPNARYEYDRANPTPQKSDCLNWNPDGLGTLTDISCSNWGCADIDDTNNSSLNYMIWNWQNLPGANNDIIYQGKRFRNLWDVYGDFDNVMQSDNRTLFR